MVFVVTVVIALALADDVNLLPIKQNLTYSLSSKGSSLNVDENNSVNFVRVRKEVAKVGFCAKGKELYKGRCRTREEIKRVKNNDFEDGDYNAFEHILNEDLSVIPKETVNKSVETVQKVGPVLETEIFQEPQPVETPDFFGKTIGEYESTTQRTSSDKNNSTARTEASQLEKESTDATLIIDAEEIYWVSPTFLLTFTFLLICSGSFLLTWIFKLLYDYYYHRSENYGSPLIQCSI